MAEHVHGQACARAAFPLGLQDRAHVVADPGHAEKAAVLVEERADLPRAELLLAHEVREDGGVEVAAAAAHHEPSRGVNPIEVSTDLPPRIAATEQPLPRWQVMSRRPSSSGRRWSSAARRRET
jgi:hypothetical protein